MCVGMSLTLSQFTMEKCITVLCLDHLKEIW